MAKRNYLREMTLLGQTDVYELGFDELRQLLGFDGRLVGVQVVTGGGLLLYVKENQPVELQLAPVQKEAE